MHTIISRIFFEHRWFMVQLQFVEHSNRRKMKSDSVRRLSSLGRGGQKLIVIAINCNFSLQLIDCFTCAITIN